MGHPTGKKNIMRTPEEKEKIVLEILSGKLGMRPAEKTYDVNHKTIYDWIKKYQESGINGLKSQTGKKSGSNKGRPKKGDEIEELKRELAKKDIIIERLKKGYAVKGVGVKKEFVTISDVNTK